MPEVPAWDEHRNRWQRILNAHEIPPRKSQHDLDPYVHVRVRLVWERDGEDLRETVAVAWSRRLVLVEVSDMRVQVRWAWVSVEDVRRVG